MPLKLSDIKATVVAGAHDPKNPGVTFSDANAKAKVLEWRNRLAPGAERDAIDSLLAREVKIIIVDGGDVNNYKSNATQLNAQEKRIVGTCRAKSNEIVIAADIPNPEKTLAHEAGHKLIQMTFENEHGRPWMGDKHNSTDKRQTLFDEAFKADNPKNKSVIEFTRQLCKDLGIDSHYKIEGLESSLPEEISARLIDIKATDPAKAAKLAEKYPELNRFHENVIMEAVKAHAEGKPVEEMTTKQYDEYKKTQAQRIKAAAKEAEARQKEAQRKAAEERAYKDHQQQVQSETFERNFKSVESRAYEILGVPETASKEEIEKAYRRKASEFHPDRNPGNPSAEAKFKELGAANELIGDAENRTKYDERVKTQGSGKGRPTPGNKSPGAPSPAHEGAPHSDEHKKTPPTRTLEPHVAGGEKPGFKTKLGKTAGLLGTVLSAGQMGYESWEVIDSDKMSTAEKAERLAEMGVGLGLDIGANIVTFGMAGGAASTLAIGKKEYYKQTIMLLLEERDLQKDYKAGKVSAEKYSKKYASFQERDKQIEEAYWQNKVDALKAMTPGVIITGAPEIVREVRKTSKIYEEEDKRFAETHDNRHIESAKNRILNKSAAENAVMRKDFEARGAKFTPNGQFDLNDPATRLIVGNELEKKKAELKRTIRESDSWVVSPRYDFFANWTQSGRDRVERYNNAKSDLAIMEAATAELKNYDANRKVVEAKRAREKAQMAAQATTNKPIADAFARLDKNKDGKIDAADFDVRRYGFDQNGKPLFDADGKAIIGADGKEVQGGLTRESIAEMNKDIAALELLEKDRPDLAEVRRKLEELRNKTASEVTQQEQTIEAQRTAGAQPPPPEGATTPPQPTTAATTPPQEEQNPILAFFKKIGDFFRSLFGGGGAGGNRGMGVNFNPGAMGGAGLGHNTGGGNFVGLNIPNLGAHGITGIPNCPTHFVPPACHHGNTGHGRRR